MQERGSPLIEQEHMTIYNVIFNNSIVSDTKSMKINERTPSTPNICRSMSIHVDNLGKTH